MKHLSRRGLYSILSLSCIMGYMWIYFGLKVHSSEINAMGVCFFKHATQLPCPSCGSTRSVLAILNGNFFDAIHINPLGFVIASILLLSPLWILFDLSTKKETLLKLYCKLENLLKHPKIAVPLVLLIIINWIWNIKKGL